MFDELLNNPMVKKALSAGEERMGKLVATVLSNERLMARIQGAFAAAQAVRTVVEKGMKSALQAASVPTADDLAELRQRLVELESIIDGLAARLDREGEPSAAPPGAAGPQDPPGAPPA
jgi:hypothetical protein